MTSKQIHILSSISRPNIQRFKFLFISSVIPHEQFLAVIENALSRNIVNIIFFSGSLLINHALFFFLHSTYKISFQYPLWAKSIKTVLTIVHWRSSELRTKSNWPCPEVTTRTAMTAMTQRPLSTILFRVIVRGENLGVEYSEVTSCLHSKQHTGLTTTARIIELPDHPTFLFSSRAALLVYYMIS